nr:RNA-directed DNA polymerase, eukaryota [Tanacetum cinerariifolium]
AKFIWGNSRFDHITSDAIGNSGGILYIWDPNVFLKDQHIILDNFVAITGTWIPTNSKLLIISIYAPQSRIYKHLLWGYISLLVTRWQGDSLVLGDFNEVMSEAERRRSIFNIYGAADFNEFISNSGLIDIQLEGYSFTWSHLSACIMSKLDRFLMTQGFFSAFPHCSAICLDRYLSNHRLILLREVLVDYGATPFCFYHSWLSISGFDLMVLQVWKSFSFGDSNDMIRFKKKLQVLKVSIREWIKTHKKNQMERRNDISLKLRSIDQQLDQGVLSDDLLLSRMNLMKQIHDFKMADSYDALQKAKIKWAIEGDENSKFFHSLVNWNHANLAIKGIMVDGNWINFLFPNRLNSEQAASLEIPITTDEIRSAVWACGENKSPRPDGSKFEFFQRFWDVIRLDFCLAFKCLTSEKASVLVNGSPTSKFQFHCGLKQGDPLAPYLFILVMESLHLSFARVVEAGIFKGLNLSNSLTVSRLFYADDAVFVRECPPEEIFYGAPDNEEKISWVKWSKILLPKKHGGLGVSSFYTLNHALLFKWDHCLSSSSLWNSSIVCEVSVLKNHGVDLVSYCVKCVDNGLHTGFWEECWIGDKSLSSMFPQIFALKNNKSCLVSDKLSDGLIRSLRCSVRGGVESQ